MAQGTGSATVTVVQADALCHTTGSGTARLGPGGRAWNLTEDTEINPGHRPATRLLQDRHGKLAQA